MELSASRIYFRFDLGHAVMVWCRMRACSIELDVTIIKQRAVLPGWQRGRREVSRKRMHTHVRRKTPGSSGGRRSAEAPEAVVLIEDRGGERQRRLRGLLARRWQWRWWWQGHGQASRVACDSVNLPLNPCDGSGARKRRT
eukprot:65746-Chlamydomonas_euryale.AAC.4